MEVRFKTKKLEKNYREYISGQKTWGQEVAWKYIQRINLIEAASDMAEIMRLPGLRCHPLHGEREGQYGITLHGRWRMIVTIQDDRAQVIRIEEVNVHYAD